MYPAAAYLYARVLKPEPLANLPTSPARALCNCSPNHCHPCSLLWWEISASSSCRLGAFGSRSPRSLVAFKAACTHLPGPSHLQPQANASAQPDYTHQDQPSRKGRRQQLAAQVKDNARTKQQRQHPGPHPGAANPATPPGPNSQPMSSNGYPAPPAAPEEAKRSRRGERDPATPAEIVTCPKGGIPKAHAALLNGMMTASLLSTKQRHQSQILLKRQDCPTIS